MTEKTGLQILIKALDFASHKHKDQRRKDSNASPYINHPIALTNLLVNEGDIVDLGILCAALLHDTVEDTETSKEELIVEFGEAIAEIVMEVTDDKSLPKAERKQAQIDHAQHLSKRAKAVKLADKTCNLRDVMENPPDQWSLERRQEYLDWGRKVIDGLRGDWPELEDIFDHQYQKGVIALLPDQKAPTAMLPEKSFAVYVDDNFHYMDESERYKYGDYATYRDAYAACMKIIDGQLPTTNSNGLSADELYRGYVGFGEDPFIVPVPENRMAFSGWDYAKTRCNEIARLPKQNEDKSPKPSTGDSPKDKKEHPAAVEFRNALNAAVIKDHNGRLAKKALNEYRPDEKPVKALNFPSSLGKPMRSFMLDEMPCVGFDDAAGAAGAALFREVGGKFIWDPIDVDWALDDARAISMAELEAAVDSIISRSTSS